MNAQTLGTENEGCPQTKAPSGRATPENQSGATTCWSQAPISVTGVAPRFFKLAMVYHQVNNRVQVHQPSEILADKVDGFVVVFS